MFDEDDELNLFYDDDDNEDRDWVNNYKEQQQSILPSQQDNNNNVDDINNANDDNDDVINLDDDDEPRFKPQYQRQHNIKKINRNVNTHIRSQRVVTPKHYNDNDNDNDSDCVIEIEKSEMTKHLEAKYENKCKIKMLTMDETKQLANERVKHKNDQAMIKEAKRKKYKTIPSNMSFNAFTGKFEQIKTAFDEAIEKEFQDNKYFIPQPQYTTNINNVNTSKTSDTLQQQHKRNYNFNYNYKTHYNSNNKDETNSTSDKSSHCSQMKFLNKKHNYNNNNKHTATHSDYSFSDNEYKSNNNNINTNTVNRSCNNYNHNHNHNNHKQYIPKDNNNNNNNHSCCTIDMTQLKYDIIKQIYTKDNHCRKDLMILFKQIKHYIHNHSTFNHHYTSLLHDHLSTPSHLDQLYSIGTFLYKTLCHHILSTASTHQVLSLTNNTIWRASDIPPIINDINTRTKP